MHPAKSNMAWRLSSAIWISTDASGLTWIRMNGSGRAVGTDAPAAPSVAARVPEGRSMWRRMRLRYAACCLLVS